MSQETVAQLDISNAFTNSELPDSRLVLITPPSILVTLGFVDKKMIWVAKRAIYGLRESPALWASTRNQGLRSLKLQGEYEIHQLETHESLWAVVRAKSVGQREGQHDENGEIVQERGTYHCKTYMRDPVGLLGVYVDDILGVGARAPILDVMSQIQVLWKTTPLEELRLGRELQFLGTWLTICEYNGTLGYWIHQSPFTEQLGLRVSKEGELKSRSTPGEPLSYSKSMHRVDDSGEYTEQQRQQEVKRLQSLLGCLMWLAYRTCPDLVYCVGVAAALLTRDLKACSSRTRHMLQYVCSHQDAGLFYGFSKDLRSEDSTLDLYGDASFAPDRGHSHTGWVLMRGSHCLAWGASRQAVVATSSCEAEVVASVTALQASFSLRLLSSY